MLLCCVCRCEHACCFVVFCVAVFVCVELTWRVLFGVTGLVTLFVAFVLLCTVALMLRCVGFDVIRAGMRCVVALRCVVDVLMCDVVRRVAFVVVGVVLLFVLMWFVVLV